MFAALQRAGWRIKRTVKRKGGSHRVLEREGKRDYTFAFHDRDEIGPPMLARIGRDTGLKPEDL